MSQAAKGGPKAGADIFPGAGRYSGPPLRGIERSAILLMTLGEEAAANVLRHMEPKEVQKLGMTMATLQSVTKDQVKQVIREFYQIVQTATSLGMDTDEYIKNVLIKALGEDKAANLIDRILTGGSIKGLEAFKWMDPRSIADLIRNEHPQVVAIVLSFLESDQAAQVLQLFPEPVRVDVVLRISTLEGIQPQALQELNDIMERQFTGNSAVKSSSVGGVRTAANILNFMDRAIEQEIVDSIKDVDSELAETIQDLMFVFQNLNDIDDKGIQTILKEVSSEDMVLALKGADEGIKNKIIKNMSKRAAEILLDDLEAKGPVKLSDVETAQKNIVAIARRLADAGTITLTTGAEQYV